jgi:hypothetical protein
LQFGLAQVLIVSGAFFFEEANMLRRFAIALVILVSGTASAADDSKFQSIDLQPYATQKRFDALGSGIEGNNLANLPGGEQAFGEVPFKVGDGILHLGSNIVDRHPDKVLGIKVNAKCGKLHVLHATCFGGGPNKPGDPLYVGDGTVIGQYMVHYGDGSGEGISIVYGEDVRDWFYVSDEAKTTRGKIVWNGENDRASMLEAKIRLYMLSWENPHPDKTITSIDYLGKKDETPAAPFCVAITLEK